MRCELCDWKGLWTGLIHAWREFGRLRRHVPNITHAWCEFGRFERRTHDALPAVTSSPVRSSLASDSPMRSTPREMFSRELA